MPFPNVIVFILRMLKKSIQKEIEGFFKEMEEEKSMSKSAFCQTRLKLKAEAYLDLNEVVCSEFYSDNEIKIWKAYRLIGIDGSTIHLPCSKELLKEFGYEINKAKEKVPMAKISTCFDLLNELILNPVIDAYSSDEYQMAIEHINKLQKGDLLILDRGYDAAWMFYLLTKKEIDFVIRISRNLFTGFWSSDKQSEVISIDKVSKQSKKRIKKLGLHFTPFSIRLVKVSLDSGETEVLATSLLDDKKYPAPVFKELYFKRWGIEEEYNHLKNHLEIENFSGKSVLAVKQDFYANTLIENLRSLFSKEAEERIKEHKSETKYEYKVNRNLSLGFLKDEIVRLLLSDDPDSYNKIEKLFLIEPVPIRKNRKVERVFHYRRARYSMNNRRSI